MSVVAFHLRFNSAQVGVFDESLPDWSDPVLDRLSMGVAVFFVLSGFVITYAMRNLTVSARTMGNFIWRRQLRLDPPYWATLFAVLAAAAVEQRFDGLVSQSYSWSETVINMFYLQGVTGSPAILSVAWTLCLEIQFYLAWVAILLVARSVGQHLAGRADRLPYHLGSALGYASLSLPILGWSSGAWFLGLWHMFWAGALLSGYLTKRLPGRPLAVFVTIWVVTLIGWGPRSLDDGWFGLLTVGVIWWAIKSNRLGLGATSGPLQYLGKISYSLYLVHIVVIDKLMSPLLKLSETSRPLAFAAAVVGLIASVVAAAVLYRAVEVPAQRLSGRFRHSSFPAERTLPAVRDA